MVRELHYSKKKTGLRSPEEWVVDLENRVPEWRAGGQFEGLLAAANGSQSSPKTSRWHAHQGSGPFNAHSQDGGGAVDAPKLRQVGIPWDAFDCEICAGAKIKLRFCVP